MKRLMLFIAALAICHTAVFPQGCLPEGITFSSQAQIDNFQTNYPGCTEIEGNVTIDGYAISNLNGLSVLTSIGGNLTAGRNWNTNPSLTSLTGLENLTFIGGHLHLHNNISLTSLTGLDYLTSIAGSLSIWGNNALVSLTELNNLTSVGGGLHISSNSALTSLTGLENLTSLPGNLYISSNNSLTSLAGLENLTSIGGYINIGSNYTLTSLTGLENVTSIGGYINIGSNYTLTSLTGLENVTSIGARLSISENNALTSLTGLENLTSLPGNLYISSNNSLTSLTGLENLTSIGGYLWISSNNALTSLTGLDNLTSIGGELTIYYNSSLSTCNSEWLCDYLSAPNGYVNIVGNASGCSLIDVASACGGIPYLPYGHYYFRSQSDIDNFQAAFPNCTELQGDVSIFGNDITNLSGLDIVTSIGGSLSIESTNSSLTNLTGLENLASIGNLWIRSNNALTSLMGLENLTSTGGLIIEDNESLTTLTGLDNIAASSLGGFYIWDNPLLSSCEVKSICDFLAAPNGEVIIYNNSPGCNSPEEVIVACATVGIDETITESGFSISPNPFTGDLSIEFHLPQTSTVSIHIFNTMGTKVAELHNGRMPAGQQRLEWDAGHLPKGIYLFRVQAGNETFTQKIIKVQ